MGQAAHYEDHAPFILHQQGAITYKDALRSDRVLEESLGGILRTATSYPEVVDRGVLAKLTQHVMGWLRNKGFTTGSLTPAHVLTLVTSSLENAVDKGVGLKSTQHLENLTNREGEYIRGTRDINQYADRMDPLHKEWSDKLDMSGWDRDGEAKARPEYYGRFRKP